MKCTQINQLQTFANSDRGAVSNPHVCPTWTGWQVAGETVICECSVTATIEGFPLVQLKQPATQTLTALLLQQRRGDRPLGTARFATVKCQLIWHFATIQVTKFAIRSVSQMNAAVQFAVARSSGHSEGCHHIKLLQPRVNAVQQIWHRGMPD